MTLNVENLTARIGGQGLVHGVSFSVAAGERVALLGASGSGKSLTGRSVLALPPAGVSYGGTVQLSGRNMLALSERALREVRGAEVGLVFQEPALALNPVHRIGPQIAEVLRRHGGDRTRVQALLDDVGLTASGIDAARYPHTLSGGQRQRVAIAIAIAMAPAMLVADEPTSALDTVTAARVLDLLFAVTAGSALLLITHDLAIARRCDRILVMEGGHLVEDAPADTVMRAPQSEAARRLVHGVKLPPRHRIARRRDQNPIMQLTNVRAYRGPNIVVDGATLSLARGERLAIVGGSGSGKTTLGRAILGLERLDGSVTLDGFEAPVSERRARIQMVFQDPATSFNPRHSVRQIVTEPLFRSDVTRADGIRRATEALAAVGLPADVLSRRPHAFSGGQRQRIAIARALVLQPEIVIADEPVSALDAALRGEIIALFDRLVRDGTIGGLILVAHDLALVGNLADTIAVMHAGQLVETGPVDAVLGAPQHAATRALLAAGEVFAGNAGGAKPVADATVLGQ